MVATADLWVYNAENFCVSFFNQVTSIFHLRGGKIKKKVFLGLPNVHNLKKQFKFQIIGILEEIHSFYWPKMHLWKGDKKIGQGPPPLIWTKSKSTADFFSGNCLLHHNGLFSDQKLKLVQLCQGAFIGMVWTWRNQLSRVLKRIQFGFPQSDYPWHKGPSSTTIGEDEQDQMSSWHLS